MKKILTIAALCCAIALTTNSQGKYSDDNASGTIKVRDREWMSENLNVSKFRNGDDILQAESAADWKIYGQKGIAAWCYYNYDPANGKQYGKLYNWYAIYDSRGLAPQGWNLPIVKDMTSFGVYYEKKTAATLIKSKTGWKNGGNGTDGVHFNALPAGYCDEYGVCHGMGEKTCWWTRGFTSDVLKADDRYGKSIVLFDTSGIIYYDQQAAVRNGYSVRCCRPAEETKDGTEKSAAAPLQEKQLPKEKYTLDEYIVLLNSGISEAKISGGINDRFTALGFIDRNEMSVRFIKKNERLFFQLYFPGKNACITGLREFNVKPGGSGSSSINNQLTKFSFSFSLKLECPETKYSTIEIVYKSDDRDKFDAIKANIYRYSNY